MALPPQGIDGLVTRQDLANFIHQIVDPGPSGQVTVTASNSVTAGAGATVNVTVTLPVTFEVATYRAFAGVHETTDEINLSVGKILTKNTGSVVVQIVNAAAGSRSGTVDVMVIA